MSWSLQCPLSNDKRTGVTLEQVNRRMPCLLKTKSQVEPTMEFQEKYKNRGEAYSRSVQNLLSGIHGNRKKQR